MYESPEQIADRKVQVVKRCIRESVIDPEFVSYVRSAFEGAKQQTIIPLLWKFQKNFLFIPEQAAIDYCKHAIEFAKQGRGDCEDFVVFNSSVLTLFGIKHRLKVMDTKGGGYYTHILLEVFDPIRRRWLPFDGTYRKRGLGGQPRHQLKIRTYKII